MHFVTHYVPVEIITKGRLEIYLKIIEHRSICLRVTHEIIQCGGCYEECVYTVHRLIAL